MNRSERRKLENQHENMSDPAFLYVMGSTDGEPLILSMRAAHEQGRKWSWSQISAVRSKMDTRRTARLHGVGRI